MDVLRWLRPHRISRREAEHLLDRLPAVAVPDVADLLAAAGAPARPDELAGEKAAVAAFRAAYGPAEPEKPKGRPVRRAVLVAALSAVVALVGGTAYAAQTGRLPDPVQQRFHETFAGVPAPEPDVRTSPTQRPSPTTTATTAAAPPAVLDLCRAWQATRSRPGQPSLRPDEQRELAAAAGGQNRIESFCAGLAASPTPSGSSPAGPGATGGPDSTGKPGNPDPGTPPTAAPGRKAPGRQPPGHTK